MYDCTSQYTALGCHGNLSQQSFNCLIAKSIISISEFEVFSDEPQLSIIDLTSPTIHCDFNPFCTPSHSSLPRRLSGSAILTDLQVSFACIFIHLFIHSIAPYHCRSVQQVYINIVGFRNFRLQLACSMSHIRSCKYIFRLQEVGNATKLLHATGVS